MRSIELLIQEYPDKTGKELLEIQKQDKLADVEEYNIRNKAKLDLIEDINTCGGYYKGTFGLEQKFIYSFSNMRLEGGDIMCDVTTIVIFSTKNSVSDIKVENRTYEMFEQYSVELYERVHKAEFDRVLNYINTTNNFWK